MYDKNKQSGHLLEIPLIMMAVALLLVILLPILPKVIGKIAVIIGGLVWIRCIHYMPGLQPGSDTWGDIVFLVVTVSLILFTIYY
jgi:hypothetical protein